MASKNLSSDMYLQIIKKLAKAHFEYNSKRLPNTGNEELLDFQGFLRYVERVSNTISKNKLEQLRKVVTRAHERRFRRRREPKYGSLNKGFTD